MRSAEVDRHPHPPSQNAQVVWGCKFEGQTSFLSHSHGRCTNGLSPAPAHLRRRDREKRCGHVAPSHTRYGLKCACELLLPEWSSTRQISPSPSIAAAVHVHVNALSMRQSEMAFFFPLSSLEWSVKGSERGKKVHQGRRRNNPIAPEAGEGRSRGENRPSKKEREGRRDQLFMSAAEERR